MEVRLADESSDLHDMAVSLRLHIRSLQARGLRLDTPGPAPHPNQATTSDWSEVAREARAMDLVHQAGLERTRSELGNCQRCKLSKSRNQIVFGVGDPAARLCERSDSSAEQQRLLCLNAWSLER